MVKKCAFDTFTSDDLLRDGKWKGNQLSPEQITTLSDEAKAFKQSFLWKVLKSELQWFALKSLIEKGETGEDIRFARTFGNVVQEVEKAIDRL